MKNPSKNMSTSLGGQRVSWRVPEPVSVGRQRRAGEAGMRIPGEGTVSNPPGKPEAATAKRYASAAGRRYGGSA